MNKSYLIIFFGILAVAMGIGDDKAEFIPSKLKLIIGLFAIAYGIYLTYKPNGKNLESASESDKIVVSKKTRPSYIYLTIGVSCFVLTKYLIRNKDYILDFWTVLVGIIGFGVSIYGLNMFFKERRKKRENGSI